MPNELILFVDDEPSIIQLARLYLEREGFRIDSANDGENALEISPVDIGMLVRSLVEKFTPQAQKAHIHLQTHTPDNLPSLLGDGIGWRRSFLIW